MLNSDLPLVYWDACVFLSYINGHAERLPQIEGVLQESGSLIQIVTSVISITEVAFAKAEQDGAALLAEEEEKIKKLWEIGSPIETIEYYELLAEDARALMRAGVPLGFSLKPLDALHLATADRLKVRDFHTYDPGLAKYAALTKTKFAIIEPVPNQSVIVP
jgi:predicted nucleic acid-binding protein